MGDDRAWVIAKFRDRRVEIETADEVSKAAFATILAMYWKAFLAEHKSPAAYGSLPRDQQMKYYKNWLNVCAKFESTGESEKVVPAELLCLFLAAIINRDREFEFEVAGFLDDYARKGWEISQIASPAVRPKLGFNVGRILRTAVIRLLGIARKNK